MLFHMLLGFLIMRALLALVRLVARLPSPVGRGWARLLNAATKPFDLVNFLGSRLGGSVVPRKVMIVLCDRTVAALHRRLDRESEADSLCVPGNTSVQVSSDRRVSDHHPA
ncbi:hypothetical protein [Lentzea sp. HUAS12]|uniref:hypothetical protein n=1 Tax=Lentzea sp. HUAS12 TaxID=2951806 RepID=UPI0020A067E4|nr:hypothetical protein [Lentzea sp. HUAS12]USX54119.1 hypothetical protein ND450_08470 [Lentzea sp. HUAS12]